MTTPNNDPFHNDERMRRILNKSAMLTQQRASEVMEGFLKVVRSNHNNSKFVIILSEIIALRMNKEFMDDLLKDELIEILPPSRSVDDLMKEINQMLDTFMKGLITDFYKQYGR